MPSARELFEAMLVSLPASEREQMRRWIEAKTDGELNQLLATSRQLVSSVSSNFAGGAPAGPAEASSPV